MPSAYQQSMTHRIAFVLDEPLIRDTVRILEDNVTDSTSVTTARAKLQFEVKQLDKRTISTNDVNELLRLPNATRSRIQILTISTTYSVEPTVRLVFARAAHGPTIAYNIAGQQVPTSFIADQLDDISARAKQWYTRVAFADAVGTVLNLILAFFFLSSIVTTMQIFTRGPAESARLDQLATFSNFTAATSAIGLAILVLVGLGFALNRLRTWLFPTGIFAFSDGIHLVARLAWWRGLLGISVLLAIGINLVSSLLL